jgi:hypothetical protein
MASDIIAAADVETLDLHIHDGSAAVQRGPSWDGRRWRANDLGMRCTIRFARSLS